jgi:AraC family transcriptional regulator, transcriptional activator of pobA
MPNTPIIPVHRWSQNTYSEDSFKLESWGKTKQDLDSLHPHRHEYHEIMCFIEGVFVHDIDFKSYESHGCEFHCVQANSVHMMVREEQAEGISLMFTSDFADPELLTALPFGKEKPIVGVSKEVFDELRQLLNLIVQEYNEKAPGYLHILRNYFQAFLRRLSRYVNEASVNTNNLVPELYRRFEESLPKAVELRSVEAFADLLHVTPKHLIDVIKQQSGRTPLQLIHEQMLTESKRMLFHTDLPIKEIAFSLGFSDSTNFTKWFKTKTGYTPVHYRTTQGK